MVSLMAGCLRPEIEAQCCEQKNGEESLHKVNEVVMFCPLGFFYAAHNQIASAVLNMTFLTDPFKVFATFIYEGALRTMSARAGTLGLTEPRRVGGNLLPVPGRPNHLPGPGVDPQGAGQFTGLILQVELEGLSLHPRRDQFLPAELGAPGGGRHKLRSEDPVQRNRLTRLRQGVTKPRRSVDLALHVFENLVQGFARGQLLHKALMPGQASGP